jgi:hypothetical protein
LPKPVINNFSAKNPSLDVVSVAFGDGCTNDVVAETVVRSMIVEKPTEAFSEPVLLAGDWVIAPPRQAKRGCQFPLNSFPTRKGTYRFCEAAVARPGASYCEAHEAVCYQGRHTLQHSKTAA